MCVGKCYEDGNFTYTISSNKHPGAYLKFWLQGRALIGIRVLNRGGCVLSSPGGNQEYLSFIIPLIHRVLN